MPEEELFKTEGQHTRAEIATMLSAAAEEIESGTVELEDAGETERVSIPDQPLFEVELERLTDSETGEMRYELEYEIRWTEASDETEADGSR
ncbi:MAG: amphi-Trp domain-containing protein [Halobacteriota archaeon]|uniref:amphi-Trp domain-containing protein n=1 Tax=Natronomonas sp. TaxID=2184060 RepID=UPI003975AA4C